MAWTITTYLPTYLYDTCAYKVTRKRLSSMLSADKPVDP